MKFTLRRSRTGCNEVPTPLESGRNSQCPLLTLPPEIRNAILELVIPHGRSIGIVSTVALVRWCPLLAVCRQLRAEALPVFFARNTFTVTLQALAYRSARWQRRKDSVLSEDPFQSMQRIQLVNNFYCKLGKRRLAHCLHVEGMLVLVDRDTGAARACQPTNSCGIALPLRTKPQPFAQPSSYLCTSACCLQARKEAESLLIEAVQSAGLLEAAHEWSREDFSALARDLYERA